MNQLKDHKVTFRSELTIAQFAKDHRSDALQRTKGNYVVAATYIFRNLLGISIKNDNILGLKIFEKSSTDTPLAFVELSSFTLNVQKSIWLKALDGHPYENFILAHELGHIVLHDHHAQSFLIDRAQQIGYVTDQQSAEWQANIFASHFLLPANKLKLDADPETLSTMFGIPILFAKNRIIENWNAKKKSGEVTYSHHQCIECGKMSVIQVGNNLVCTICPPTQFLEDSSHNC